MSGGSFGLCGNRFCVYFGHGLVFDLLSLCKWFKLDFSKCFDDLKVLKE